MQSKTKIKKAFEVLCMFLKGYRKIRLEQGTENWTTDRIRRENSLLMKKVVHCHEILSWDVTKNTCGKVTKVFNICEIWGKFSLKRGSLGFYVWHS